jgi:GntR family transcriptional regulator, rspAB operon transcriptional repressor
MRASSSKAPLMRDDVYERIRDDILSCTLQPGSPVHEQALAQRFQVSKSPIRDALLRLQEQHLVEVLPRKGYRVRPVSLADAVEMYEMRLLYERECALRAIDHADDATLAALDAFRTGPRGRDLPKWIDYNRRFHLAVAEASGNSRLARAAIEVIEQFDRLTYVGVNGSATPAGVHKFADEHAAIIDALQARDRRRAGALIRDHIEASRKRTLASLAHPVIVP